MCKSILLLSFCSLFVFMSFQDKNGYDIGDKVENFTLKNVDGKMVSLSDYNNQKGVVVIFTCNHCPFSVKYEDRINMIHNRFGQIGVPVIAINPNDPEVQPKDSFEAMQVRAKEKDFKFAYLFDNGQKIFPQFGATKTPHVFLLKNEKGAFTVQYIGAIDDNADDVTKINENYLLNAIDALTSNREISPKVTKAVGCSIKVKK
jgi:peroxiredoxin